MKMTRDEILAMPAGREMDALITEKVMSGHVKRRSDGTPHYLTWTPYSTDMGAAWEVVEKMAHEPFAWHIESVNIVDGLMWFVCYWGDGSKAILDWSTDCESLTLAICRVALLSRDAEPLD